MLNRMGNFYRYLLRERDEPILMWLEIALWLMAIAAALVELTARAVVWL